MAGTVRTIGTKITLSGEKEFNDAIKRINNSLTQSSAELRQAAAAYDANGDAQAKLKRESELLQQQLNSKNETLKILQARMEDAKNGTKKLSEEGMRKLNLAITNTTTDIYKLDAALKKTKDESASLDREVEELGRDSRRAGNQLEDNLGEAADDVTTKFERMVGSINDSLTDIRNMQGVSLAVDLVRGAWNVGSQAYQWAQGYSQENMKTAMAQYNVQAAGGNWEQTARLAIQYASIFGDKDSALEAISNLTAAGYTDQSIEKMAQYLGGAAIRWQDTLKIESLADSLQESLAEGVLTGQFAELINRLAETTGITQEQVAAQLAEAKKYGQEKEAIEAYLENAGLSQIYEGFVDQNQAMIDAAVAAGDLDKELATLANTVNQILAPAIKLMADGVGWINKELEPWNPDYSEKPISEEQKEKTGYDPDKYVTYDPNYKQPTTPIRSLTKTEEAITELLTFPIFGFGRAGGEVLGDKKTTAISHAQREAMMLASGQSTYAASLFVQPLQNVSDEVEAQLAETEKAATEGGSKIGSSLWAGLQSQTSQLLAIAQQQRTLLEAVWEDPITPTVVVSYGTAPGATGGKPNLPTLPSSVNVTVELDKRKLGEVVVPMVDNAMGGAAGAFADKIY